MTNKKQITLIYCEKHDSWDSHNCPDCTAEQACNDTAFDIFSRVEYIIYHIGSQHGFINSLRESPDYQAIKAKYQSKSQ